MEVDRTKVRGQNSKEGEPGLLMPKKEECLIHSETQKENCSKIVKTDSHKIKFGDWNSKLLICCEHASNRLPDDWTWPEADIQLSNTHWAVDKGAKEVATLLSRNLNVHCLLARFTRLLIDANRNLESDTLFRDTCDGNQVQLNRKENLTNSDIQKRISRYYIPFHNALDELLQKYPIDNVFSIHSFTPNYEGKARSLEIGVLFDKDTELGHQICSALKDLGYDAQLNQPWAGNVGLGIIIEKTQQKHKRTIAFELNQSFAGQAGWRNTLVNNLAKIFKNLNLV